MKASSAGRSTIILTLQKINLDPPALEGCRKRLKGMFGSMATSRRSLLLTLLIAGGGYSALRFGPDVLARIFPADFEFEELSSPAGFRRIAAGKSSAALDPFVGIDSGDPQREKRWEAIAKQNICAAVFPSWDSTSDSVPIASFSDYNCPFCKVLTQRIAAREEAQLPPISVSWHELPLLGQSSRDAALGALAAKRQGAYAQFHKRLMRARFVTTPAFLERLANDIGIEPQKMIADMQSRSVAEEIELSMAVSRVFAFIGTPALVIGRTVVQGEISEANLDRLIEIERLAGPPPGCT